MIVLREMARAKVNLYLHIIARRTDGYHVLDSLVGFADIGDKLEVAASDDLTLVCEGPYASYISSENNLVLKAAKALRLHAGITTGAALTLTKQLPVAAGIGGGSADAAAALRLLVRFWNLKFSRKELSAIALDLGADVPVCLRSESLYMNGIGEQLEKGPALAGLHMVLVHCGKPLATKDVFAAFAGAFSVPARHPAEFASVSACAEFLGKLHNDLQAPAIELLPEIALALEAIAGQKGCLLARMSGSGATCVGLFGEGEAAQHAAQVLSAKQPSWWVKAAAMR